MKAARLKFAQTTQNIRLFAGAILTAMFVASCAMTKQNPNPLYSFTPPPGWTYVHSSENRDIKITEYAPSGQTIENWEEMITIQTFPKGGNQAIQILTVTIIQWMGKRCMDKPFVRFLKTKSRRQKDVILARFACDNMDISNPPHDVLSRKNELLILLARDCGNSILSIQYAWHHETKSAVWELNMNVQRVRKALHSLKQFKVHNNAC